MDERGDDGVGKEMWGRVTSLKRILCTFPVRHCYGTTASRIFVVVASSTITADDTSDTTTANDALVPLLLLLLIIIPIRHQHQIYFENCWEQKCDYDDDDKCVYDWCLLFNKRQMFIMVDVCGNKTVIASC